MLINGSGPLWRGSLSTLGGTDAQHNYLKFLDSA